MLVHIVYHLLNLCISSHSLPVEWQIHLIVPVDKSGPKTDIKNYHPISLLCILSKIMEKLIHDKIVNTVSKLISPLQFGFRRGRSSLQQLLVFINTLIEAHESSTPMDTVYLDIRKAFDSAPHKKLLSYGLSGSVGACGIGLMPISLIDDNVFVSTILSQKCCLCYLGYPRAAFSVCFYLFFMLMIFQLN